MMSDKSLFDSIMIGIQERLKRMLAMSKSFKLSDYAYFVDTFNKSDRIFTFFYTEWKLLNI